MKKSHYSFKRLANRIAIFHGLYILMLFMGAFILFWYPEYAIIHIRVILGTAAIQIANGGECPLTQFENLALERYRFSAAYWNPVTHTASFIRHYAEELFGWKLPRGTTIGLLFAVFLRTVYVWWQIKAGVIIMIIPAFFILHQSLQLR